MPQSTTHGKLLVPGSCTIIMYSSEAPAATGMSGGYKAF